MILSYTLIHSGLNKVNGYVLSYQNPEMLNNTRTLVYIFPYNKIIDKITRTTHR